MRLHYTLIFSALLLFVTLPAFSQAQDRVEADDFVFNSKSSQMNSASYWSYDDFDLKRTGFLTKSPTYRALPANSKAGHTSSCYGHSASENTSTKPFRKAGTPILSICA